LRISQTEARSNQHDGPKGLNQSVEYLPIILCLKDLRTLLALADALHFNQVYGVRSTFSNSQSIALSKKRYMRGRMWPLYFERTSLRSHLN
jgi:hypothetical protein